MDRSVEVERASVHSKKSTVRLDACERDAEGHASPALTKRLPWSKRISSIIWDSFDKSPEERAFIAKIDWWILSYCCVAYWSKYLSQTNVSNAYVSGMKEDLSMVGNEYNLLTTYWTVGYILGNIPSQLILTKVRASLWLPSLELAWSFVVMGMAGARDVPTLYALRFISGLLEASAYPGIMTLLGSWYTPAELGKRACIFQASSSAAQMFSGYLQAGLYSGMDGRAGLAAWRWLFVFDGLIGVPVALYGYLAIPDAPATARARWLGPRDREMAVARMARVGRAPMGSRGRLTWRVVRDALAAWPAWLFSAIFVVHVLGIKVYSYFNLWLKATGLWTTEQVNEIPTAGYALQILFTLSYAWTSDALQARWPVIMFAALVALVGSVILAIYLADNIAAMMAGWLLTFCETGAGALMVTWANEVCTASAEQRVIVIGVMETLAFSFSAWVPLFIFDTGEAPQFRIGYKLAALFFALEMVLVVIIRACEKKWPQYGACDESSNRFRSEETDRNGS